MSVRNLTNTTWKLKEDVARWGNSTFKIQGKAYFENSEYDGVFDYIRCCDYGNLIDNTNSDCETVITLGGMDGAHFSGTILGEVPPWSLPTSGALERIIFNCFSEGMSPGDRVNPTLHKNRAHAITVIDTIHIMGGDDVENPDLISWLETNGIQLKVTDLTNTTWTVASGWEAEAGYGQFSINGKYTVTNYSNPEERDFALLEFGYRTLDDGASANRITIDKNNGYFTTDSFIFNFSSGDTTNPKLIAWLSKWGELLEEKITDLTGYTVTVPAGWSASAGYGLFDVHCMNDSTETFTFANGLAIGYIMEDAPEWTPYANSICDQHSFMQVAMAPTGFTFYIGSGTDVTNPSLIDWLYDNNATFTKEDSTDKLTDLTGTKWRVKEGWEAEAGYGVYKLNFYTSLAAAEDLSVGQMQTHLLIGYTFDMDRIGDIEIESGWTFLKSQNSVSTIPMLDHFSEFTLKIFDGDDVTNSSLIDWLYTYGELITEEPTQLSATIQHNGTTTQLSINQTATFPCSGLVMKDDVSIAFATNGMIKYDDVVTPIDEGHTATFSCKNKIMKSDIEVIIKQLDAATIELDGDVLKVYDNSNLGEFATLYVDDAAVEKIDLNSMVIVNPLEGSTIGEANRGGLYTVYQYEFENGSPTSVTLNGVTSDTSVTQVILESSGDASTITVYISGKIEVYNEASGDVDTHDSLDCEIVFATTRGSVARDFFTVRGYIRRCFAAGTLISTPNGFIPIEQIQEGDIVYCYNFSTNSIEEDEVLYFDIQNGSTDIHYITFDNGNRIGATSTHAFMTDDGWKCIAPNEYTSTDQQLIIGDRVQTSDGGYTTITNIELDSASQPIYHISLTNGACLLVAGDKECMPVLAEHLNLTALGISKIAAY